MGSINFRMESRLSLAARMLVAMRSGDSRHSEYGQGPWIINSRRTSIVHLSLSAPSLQLSGHAEYHWMPSIFVASGLLPGAYF